MPEVQGIKSSPMRQDDGKAAGGVLALVLIVFSVLSYTFVAHSTRQRTDDSLKEIADSVAASFALEYKEEKEKSSESAAAEVAREQPEDVT